MTYQIGDSVIHWTYGTGRIIGMDEKTLAGKTRQYYVVEIGTLTLWVPIEESGESSLRHPAPSSEFRELLKIIHSPGEPLADNQYQRQTQVIQRMQKKTLEDICSIIRDLICWSRAHKMTKNDSDLLRRAENLLLDEWVLSLGTTREFAQIELSRFLKGE